MKDEGCKMGEPIEINTVDTVDGVGGFLDLYAAFSGNPPDQVITLVQ